MHLNIITDKYFQVSHNCGQNEQNCLDFETERYHTIVVNVMDDGYPSRNAWFNLNISVSDVKEGPSDIRLSDYIVYTVGTVVDFITCEYTENDDVAFAISDSFDTFDVQNKQLVLKKRLNYEK